MGYCCSKATANQRLNNVLILGADEKEKDEITAERT